MTSKIFDSKKLNKLESEERYKLLNPQQTLQQLGLKSNHNFLDVGSGTGFFTIPAAKIITANQTAYAVDLSPDMNAFLAKRVAEEKLSNVEILLSKGEDALPVKHETIDFALVAFVLHEVDEHAAFLGNIKQVLRDGGILAIIEWQKKQTKMGPPLDHRIDAVFIQNALENCGFSNIKTTDLSDSHYAVTAEK